ncbi:hypothetical protein BLNAU_16082 [Blattamonas nauphoetae]|uniref:Uncharacterized protein n=1 Tax=Blattamonas nauphoetae TaxID=2049346 RepID=A0ABQ9XAL5_9EUKA|nr:hypothetical protein BLNAU_16082 [Blattamonas nauphoetae]
MRQGDFKLVTSTISTVIASSCARLSSRLTERLLKSAYSFRHLSLKAQSAQPRPSLTVTEVMSPRYDSSSRSLPIIHSATVLPNFNQLIVRRWTVRFVHTAPTILRRKHNTRYQRLQHTARFLVPSPSSGFDESAMSKLVVVVLMFWRVLCGWG